MAKPAITANISSVPPIFSCLCFSRKSPVNPSTRPEPSRIRKTFQLKRWGFFSFLNSASFSSRKFHRKLSKSFFIARNSSSLSGASGELLNSKTLYWYSIRGMSKNSELPQNTKVNEASRGDDRTKVQG